MSETAPVPDLAPSPQLAADANGQPELFEEATADLEGFWARQARERLTWDTDFEQVLDWSEAPFAKWFVGGRLNVAHNCVDRHVEAGNGDRVALLWEGEPGDERRITYAELTDEVTAEVQRLAAAAFDALGCEGLARVDCFVTEGGEVVINEINTMPGFTPHSMYPRMWAQSGLPYRELITELLELALERPTGLR